MSIVCSSFYIIRKIETVLRKFDHGDLMLREFGENTSLISELSSYLREPTIKYTTECHAFERIQCLQKFPLIKQMYLKYNCISPTEADVERVFSFAGRFKLIRFPIKTLFCPMNVLPFNFHTFWYWVCCVVLSISLFSCQRTVSIRKTQFLNEFPWFLFLNRFDFAAQSSAHVR